MLLGLFNNTLLQNFLRWSSYPEMLSENIYCSYKNILGLWSVHFFI